MSQTSSSDELLDRALDLFGPASHVLYSQHPTMAPELIFTAHLPESLMSVPVPCIKGGITDANVAAYATHARAVAAETRDAHSPATASYTGDADGVYRQCETITVPCSSIARSASTAAVTAAETAAAEGRHAEPSSAFPLDPAHASLLAAVYPADALDRIWRARALLSCMIAGANPHVASAAAAAAAVSNGGATCDDAPALGDWAAVAAAYNVSEGGFFLQQRQNQTAAEECDVDAAFPPSHSSRASTSASSDSVTKSDVALANAAHSLATSNPFLALSGASILPPLLATATRSRPFPPPSDPSAAHRASGEGLLAALQQDQPRTLPASRPLAQFPLAGVSTASAPAHFVDPSALAIAALETRGRSVTDRLTAPAGTAHGAKEWRFAPLSSSSSSSSLSAAELAAAEAVARVPPVMRLLQPQSPDETFLRVADVAPLPRALLTVASPAPAGSDADSGEDLVAAPTVTYGGYAGGALEWSIHARRRAKLRCVCKAITVEAPFSVHAATAASLPSAPAPAGGEWSVPLRARPIWRLQRLGTAARVEQGKAVDVRPVPPSGPTSEANTVEGAALTGSSPSSAAACAGSDISGAIATAVGTSFKSGLGGSGADLVLSLAFAGAGTLSAAGSFGYTLADADGLRRASLAARHPAGGEGAPKALVSTRVLDAMHIPSVAHARPGLMWLPTPSPAFVAAALRALPALPSRDDPWAVDETRAAPRRFVGALQLSRYATALSAADALLAPDAETNLVRLWSYGSSAVESAVCVVPRWLSADAASFAATAAGAMRVLRPGAAAVIAVAAIATPLHLSTLYLLYRTFARLDFYHGGAASASTGLAGQGGVVVARELRERAPVWAAAPLEAAAAAAGMAGVCGAGTWVIPAKVIAADGAFMQLVGEAAAWEVRAEEAGLAAVAREWVLRRQDQARARAAAQGRRVGAGETLNEETGAHLAENEDENMVRVPVLQYSLDSALAEGYVKAWKAAGTFDGR